MADNIDFKRIHNYLLIKADTVKKLKHPLKIKRIYERKNSLDGMRILVDRLWPRGIKKVDAHVDLWLKDITPSRELRTWFGHDRDRFDEFKIQYLHELKAKHELFDIISEELKKQPVTLLYAAHDPDCNHAIVLQEAIQNYIKQTRV